MAVDKSMTQDRLDRHDQHLTKHDREIAAIRALILSGMRILKETAAIQKRTEKNLEALTNSLRRGGNGHSKRRVDIQ
jgi:hypothetical protein